MVAHDPHQADRRARPQRHPPAGAGRSRRQADLCVRDLRARHHRRQVRARRRERRSGDLRDPARRLDHHRLAASPSRRSPSASACSNMSISPGPIRSSPAARSTRARKSMGINLAKEAPVEADVVVPVPDGGTPAAHRLCAGRAAFRSSYGIIRNHYVGPHLHRADAVDPRLRRQAQAFGQPRRDRRQARRADRRFDRARHHLAQDRADDPRGRRRAKCISASPAR